MNEKICYISSIVIDNLFRLLIQGFVINYKFSKLKDLFLNFRSINISTYNKYRIIHL